MAHCAPLGRRPAGDEADNRFLPAALSFVFITVLLDMLAGGQFLTIGVIGEYLGRMYSEVRGRPLFVIDEIVRGQAATTVALDRPRRDVA